MLTAPSGLHGAEITLRFPSVGATETLLLAAACARGRTILRGAAREPEIADRCRFSEPVRRLHRGGRQLHDPHRRAVGGFPGCLLFRPCPTVFCFRTLACGVQRRRRWN